MMCNIMLKHYPPLETGTTDYSVRSLRCVSAAEYHTTEQTVLQNGQKKTPDASLKEQSIMKYSPGLPQDTKPLSCSENRAKMRIKLIFESDVTDMSRLLQHGSANR